MKQGRCWLAIAAGAALLAGCGHGSAPSLIHVGPIGIGIEEHAIVVRADDAPDARIAADGGLSIGGEVIPVSAAEREQLAAYYRAAAAIADHGIETGKAGAHVGVTAAKEVVAGLTNGDTSHIDERIKAEAEKVKVAARRLCDDIEAMRAAQQGIVATLERFRPYAKLGDHEGSDCRDGVR